MSPFCGFAKHLISVVFFLFMCFSIASSQGYCKTDDGRLGQCKLLRDCTSAISDLKSAVNPTLCRYNIQRRVIICCPIEQRISEKKCDQYTKLLEEKVYSAVPMMANSHVDYSRKNIDCSGLKQDVQYIVGGRNSRTEEYPHMVAIGYGRFSQLQFKCGGSLISENFVLTAAHCIQPPSVIPTFALLGDTHLDPELSIDPRREILAITKIYVHPGYQRPKKYNDIALLQLERYVNFSQAIRPACLPSPNLQHEFDEDVTATGWGRVGLGDSSEVLQAVKLSRYSLRECNSYYYNSADRRIRYPEGIVRSQICAGDKSGGKDTCQGDSGGPLIISNPKIPCLYHVIGLTSFGSSVCGTTQPGVYTNVQTFLKWIESIVWS